jgi:SAM-dependent methyltransferase
MATEQGTRLEQDRNFAGAVPGVYEQLLVPMIFAPYARDLATRIAARPLSAVLEIAAGTGVVTRELVERLPEAVSIVATDLNVAMLDEAARVGTKRPVLWQRADALQLPFDAQSFDAVVCQFGVMFFPDRASAYAQVRRVLRPGGAFVFNSWDRLEANGFTEVVQLALNDLYADEAPDFMRRTPHGYFDAQLIRDDLARAGFSARAAITTLSAISQSASARSVAEAFCQGTPLRAAIEARGPEELARATDAVERALVLRFGSGSIESTLSALVVEVVA